VAKLAAANNDNKEESTEQQQNSNSNNRDITSNTATGNMTGLSSFEQMIAGVSKTTLDVDLDELLA
jgi:hypothetical protein